MRAGALLLLASLSVFPAVGHAADWGSVTTPTPGPARVIGGPADGCLAGAGELPPDGPGYEAIRLSRHRNYGHPETIAFVERLGREARASELETFYVGDMAQPRGGPMTYGHGAHENGTDVDIWFNLDPKPVLPPAERETVDLPLMVLPDRSAIDPSRFGVRQVTLLRLAARDSKVDRIFVHPTIKRALCEGRYGARDGDASWLHKIRPWYGHDEHFHVRLECPPDSPACVGQAPIPAGDGCDQSLDWWFERHALQPLPTPTSPPPRRRVPEACEALLAAP
jgi:penicillin-insensitive murein endopeptidase